MLSATAGCGFIWVFTKWLEQRRARQRNDLAQTMADLMPPRLCTLGRIAAPAPSRGLGSVVASGPSAVLASDLERGPLEDDAKFQKPIVDDDRPGRAADPGGDRPFGDDARDRKRRSAQHLGKGLCVPLAALHAGSHRGWNSFVSARNLSQSFAHRALPGATGLRGASPASTPSLYLPLPISVVAAVPVGMLPLSAPPFLGTTAILVLTGLWMLWPPSSQTSGIGDQTVAPHTRTEDTAIIRQQ